MIFKLWPLPQGHCTLKINCTLSLLAIVITQGNMCWSKQTPLVLSRKETHRFVSTIRETIISFPTICVVVKGVNAEVQCEFQRVQCGAAHKHTNTHTHARTHAHNNNDSNNTSNNNSKGTSRSCIVNIVQGFSGLCVSFCL